MEENQENPENLAEKNQQRNFVTWVIVGFALLLGCVFGSILLFRGLDTFGEKVAGTDETPSEKREERRPTEVEDEGEIIVVDQVTYLGDERTGYVKVGNNEWKKLEREWSKGVQYYSGLYVMLISALNTETGSAKDYAQSLYDIAVPTLNVDNVTLEKTTLGNYDEVYKIVMKDERTSSWNVEWIFEAEDEKIHYILIQGTDLESEKFKIPETFTLTLPE